MERNLVAEDLKSSSDEETDRSNDDAGTGRSYECVFCKRGFTTAQALGGHMNIHRKDRAKPIRPNSTSIPSISTKFDEDYDATLRGYSAIQSYPPALYSSQFNYQTFLPESSWGFRPPIGEGFYGQSPQILNHVEEDWPQNLSLQIGPSDDHVDATREEEDDGSEADELDLELRLGHDP